MGTSTLTTMPSRPTAQWLRWLTTIMAVICLVAMLYVGSFLAFRSLPYTFSLAPPDSPDHYVVIFSRNTDVHCAARAIYWPLITAIPGQRCYPTRDQHELLSGFHTHAEEFDDEQ